MGCSAIVEGERVIGHICRVDGQTRVYGKRRRKFWCFRCRKRVLHTLMVHEPTQPSYYGPNFWYQCPTCKGDYTRFPGFWLIALSERRVIKRLTK